MLELCLGPARGGCCIKKLCRAELSAAEWNFGQPAVFAAVSEKDAAEKSDASVIFTSTRKNGQDLKITIFKSARGGGGGYPPTSVFFGAKNKLFWASPLTEDETLNSAKRETNKQEERLRA